MNRSSLSSNPRSDALRSALPRMLSALPNLFGESRAARVGAGTVTASSGDAKVGGAGISRFTVALLGLVAMGSSVGCQTAYYAGMEKLGVHKRDLMVNRVEAARDAQEDAVEQFDSALDRFQSVLGTSGGSLQEKYDSLNADLEASQARADAVRIRVQAVEDVAEALFDEWEDELEQYSSAQLRASSERQLKVTRQQYDQLHTAMQNAEAKIEPVMTVFSDQVLFLKHNLNAQAISSLRGELTTIEKEVGVLVREMKIAIAEANSFISTMGGV